MRILTALGLTLAAPALFAQSNTKDPASSDVKLEECALVKNGVQRLACYDAMTNPVDARDSATELEQEKANNAAEKLNFEPTKKSETDPVSNGEVEESKQPMPTQWSTAILQLNRRFFRSPVVL